MMTPFPAVKEEVAQVREKMLIFGAPWIERSEVDEVIATMEAGWLGTGPRVAKFERAFAEYRRTNHVAAVNSCTAAMHLALITAGIGPGDEVITTPLTFASTVNVIVHAGATPVLADIDLKTMNLDPAAAEAAITPRTRALLPVHLTGRPCDMDALMAIAARHGLLLIEDCAHAIEAEYRGRPCGTMGDYGCFSFYSTKNVTTGEGGMVVCARAEDADRVKTFALHGMTKDAWTRFSDKGYNHYDIVECGFKYNMMDLQAAIGLHQLNRVEEGLARREALWQRYDEAFAGLPVTLPAPAATETRHARHLYTLLVDRPRSGVSRDEFLVAMTQRKIGVGVHYRSIPELTFYQQRFGWRPEAWPNAHAVGQTTVSIPMAANLREADANDVIEAVHSTIGRRR
jgi:dTDP-4-amino-4,6-dideoxygalactose transaminase